MRCLDSQTMLGHSKHHRAVLILKTMKRNKKEINDIYIAEALKEGMEDIEKGNVRDGKEVMKEMKIKYGFDCDNPHKPH